MGNHLHKNRLVFFVKYNRLWNLFWWLLKYSNWARANRIILICWLWRRSFVLIDDIHLENVSLTYFKLSLTLAVLLSTIRTVKMVLLNIKFCFVVLFAFFSLFISLFFTPGSYVLWLLFLHFDLSEFILTILDSWVFWG